MDCTMCGIEEIAPERYNLGYRVCLTCGEINAKMESERKARRVAIAYDKGGYQYITEDTKLEDLG